MRKEDAFNQLAIRMDEDMLYVREARTALLDLGSPAAFVDDATCRIFACMAVTLLESLIAELRASDEEGILAPYFEDRAPNPDRVTALFKRFRCAGLSVRRDVFEDYLVMKYIRNAVLHARPLKSDERQWLETRGFLTGLSQFDVGHWERMQVVEQAMLKYISAAGIPLMEALIRNGGAR